MTDGEPFAKVTLITGGGSGIGAGTTRRLLTGGHRVAVTGRDAAKLDRLAAELDAGGNLLTLPGDASDYAAVSDAVAATVKEYGRLDNVVANAGFTTGDTLANGDPERWRDMVLTNVLGPALLIKAALPHLRQTRGRIILVGSVAGFKNTPGNLYSATKFAITGLAENARMLVTGDGIGVTLVAPGLIDTPFYDVYPTGTPDAPNLGPEPIAEAIAWALEQPPGVDVNTLVVRPIGQAI